MNTDTKPRKEQKFFFDQNNFDDDHEEEVEEIEPPPPMFSEAELESAKRKAFKEGHNEATLEEKNSRAQHLNAVMDQILANMSTLFEQDDAREKRFEEEAVNLTRSIFETVFPYYSQREGYNELLHALKTITDKHSKQDAVIVRVNPDLVDGITTYLKKIETKNPDIRFEVAGDANITDTSCHLSWKNGGASHDPKALAQEIFAILDDGLAGKPANSHDNEGTQPPAAPVEDQATDDASEGEHNPVSKEQSDE
ncbi:MAG: hypothetical protein JKY71_10255 [Alphaproteobacteria bacterium]|nr:hypothetical protein [Alphaproteobacteria bacterium]